MTTPTPVVIFLYNRLFDPLIQGNFWMYIKNILDDPDAPYRLHVVTYEDPAIPLTPEQEKLVAHWQSQGLEWTQLSHRHLPSSSSTIGCGEQWSCCTAAAPR